MTPHNLFIDMDGLVLYVQIRPEKREKLPAAKAGGEFQIKHRQYIRVENLFSCWSM